MRMIARIVTVPANLTAEDRRALVSLMLRRMTIDNDTITQTAARLMAGLPVNQADYKALKEVL